MSTKKAAVKKTKTSAKVAANKNTKKTPVKAVSKTIVKAKAPAKKATAVKAVTKKPIAKKNTVKNVAPASAKKAPAKKPVVTKQTAKTVKTTKTVARKPAAKIVAPKTAPKTVKGTTKKAPAKVVNKTSAISKTPLKAAAPNQKTTAKNMPKTKTVETKAKATITKTAAKAPATKKEPVAKKNDLSVEEAVARVMRVVGNDADQAVKATATAKTAKVTKADKAIKPAKNDNVFDYKAGDMVVYPAHGVGMVEGVENLTIGGLDVTLYTITFTKDRMRLKLPLQKVKTSGLRPLSTKEQMQSAMQTMRGRARIKRVMWSRRAQEYEAKINSGSPVQVAEVLRDLRRNAMGAENSYSERQIFQAALERLASELAAIEKINEVDAAQKLQDVLTEAA
jgi:CarD family transcriptional regulator